MSNATARISLKTSFISFYLFLAVVGSSLRCGPSVIAGCGASGCGCGLPLAVTSLVAERRMGRVGFSSGCTAGPAVVAPVSRAQAQELWRTGCVAPWHVGSSWISFTSRNWFHFSPGSATVFLKLILFH